jgi:hypothetical protein
MGGFGCRMWCQDGIIVEVVEFDIPNPGQGRQSVGYATLLLPLTLDIAPLNVFLV